jgi:hypothetical protein
MKTLLAFLFVGVVLLTVAPPAAPQAAGPDDQLAERVRKAITKAAKYLKDSNSQWENDPDFPGGRTALAVLALLNSGVVKADDPVIRDSLKKLREYDKPGTYVRSLITMALIEAGQTEDLERVRGHIFHLVRVSADYKGGILKGWGYNRVGNLADRPDFSNTQYALLAIYTARSAEGGTMIPEGFWDKVFEADKASGFSWPQFWQDVQAMYTRSQTASGGWPYAPDGDGGGGANGPRLTMTSAGLCGLLMAQMELNRTKGGNIDLVKDCGVYDDSPAIAKGFSWIYTPPNRGGPDHFRLLGDYPFYNMYGIERLGRYSGQRFIGAHDWYREGCRWLVDNQKDNGSWLGSGKEINPVASSFALLFLSKGRTPVLVSKMVHGNDEDWNRRRNDLRHLVDFTSKQVFNKMPLAWQNFDVARGMEAAANAKVEPHLLESQLASELLQSPVLYITGHDAIDRRLSGSDKAVIKKYIESGGFIVAVACCGKADFDKGFHRLCEELWPENVLTTLDIDHPIWSMRFDVKPGAFPLKGLQMGCKTVLVYCPENLTGYWEYNLRQHPQGKVAFELGANILAYGSGLEAPKPRLTTMPLTPSVKLQEDAVKRGFLQVGQIISKVGEEADWKPAPEAMAKLMNDVRTRDGLDVVLKTANVPIDSKELVNFKFLYLHGRKNFKFNQDQLKQLRFNLKNGGLLLADACCGKQAFDDSFRQFINDLFPREAFPGVEEDKLPRLQPIPPDDPLFGKDVNDVPITKVDLRTERGKKPEQSAPKLEGVKIGDRWVVIYSKYDIGCALENHQAADCQGYTHDSALRLGRAALLYQLRP